MIYDAEKDEITFETTGRKEYAFSGILGLGENYTGHQEVFYGYDGGLNTEAMTREERAELADYVIAKWQKFKEEKN